MRGMPVLMTSEKAKKWQQYKFKDPERGMSRLTYLTSYNVESMVKGIAYIADETRFAIVRTEGFLVCDIDQMPELAQDLIPILKQEVLDIYEDLRDLKLWEVIYA